MVSFRPLFLFAACLLASCSSTDYITVDAFEVLRHNGGQTISREQGVLSAAERQQVNAWLNRHDGFFASSMASWAPGDVCYLEGNRASINLVDGRRMVMNLPSGQYVKELEPEDHAVLQLLRLVKEDTATPAPAQGNNASVPGWTPPRGVGGYVPLKTEP